MLKAVNKDKTAVTVTLKDELTEEEVAALEGATITLTDAEGNTIEATIDEEGYNKDNKTIKFNLPEGKELVDAEKYTVTSELFEDAEFTAKVADEKIVAIDTETTGINAKSKDIYLTAENQYGKDATNLLPKAKKSNSKSEDEDIKQQKETVKITGTLNGNLPLTDADFNYEEGVITVENDTIFAKEGNKVSITVEITEEVTGEDGKQSTVTIAKNTFDYTIGEEEDSQLTTIKDITAVVKDDASPSKVVEEVKPNYTVELTADLRDQFGNAFTLNEGSNDIRWVVTEGKEFLESPQVSQDTGATVTYKAKSPGKVVITAYHLASGAQKSYEFEIQKTTINKLTFNEENEIESPIHNKEETTAGTLTVNEGATLTADLVDFKVEEKDENGKWVAVAKDVVNPVAKDVRVEGSEDLKTTVTVKPEKSGEYKVTPFVKGTDGKEINAQAFTFTSAPNQAITKIEVAEVKPEVLKVVAEGQDQHAIEIPVKFYNKHGEEIIANQKDADEEDKDETKIAVKSIATDIVEDSKVEIKNNTDEKGNITSQVLSITPKKAGDAVISLQAPGQKPIILDYKFVEAKLEAVTVEKKELDAMIAGDLEPVAYNEVKFLDQDGEELTKPEDAKIEILDANGKALDEPVANEFKAELVEIYTDEDGKIQVVPEESLENVVVTDAVKVLPAEGTPAGKYTIKVIAQAADKEVKEVATTFTVEVKEARAIKSVTVEPTTTQTTQGGTIEVLVKPVDQYGGVVAGEEKQITVQPAEVDGEKPESNFEVSTSAKPVYHNEKGEAVEESAEGAKLVGYTVELTGKKLGEQELVFTVGKGDTAKTAKETFTVGTALDLIEAVEVLVEKEQYITADGEQKVDLKAKVTDEEGKEVKVPAENLEWKITSVKDAKGNVLTLKDDKIVMEDTDHELHDKEVKIEVDEDTKEAKLVVPENLTVDVEVEVTTENSKKAKAEYTFKGDARKFVKDLALHSVNGTVAEKITPGNAEVKLEAAEDGTVPTEVKLTFSGIDQYGDTFLLTDDITVKVPGATDVVDVEQKKGSVDDKKVTATTLTLTALKAGETVLFVEQGDETIEVKVTVSKEVGDKVAAITALNTAIDELPNPEEITADILESAVEAVEAAEEAIANANAAGAKAEAKQAETNVQAVKDKIQELKDAQQALEDAKKALDDALEALPTDVTATDLETAKEKVKAAEEKLTALKDLDENAEEINEATKAIKAVQDKIDVLNAKQSLESAIQTAKGKLDEEKEYKKSELDNFNTAITAAENALKAEGATVDSLNQAKTALETATKNEPAEKEARTEPELTVATADGKKFTGLTVEGATVTVIVDNEEKAVSNGSYVFEEAVNEITVKVVYAADDNNKKGEFTITYTVSEQDGTYTVAKKSE